MRLDSTYEFETPEGVILELRLAGLLPRALAWFLDFCIRVGLFLIFWFIASYIGSVGFAVLLIAFFVIEWFYPVLFEVYKGATPGKKALKLRVCHDDGTPVAWGGALTRNLLRVVDFMPFLNALGGLVVMFSPEFKRIGDYVAGTVVVYQDSINSSYTDEERPSEVIPVKLSLEEQRSVLAFRERSIHLSGARKEELASHLCEVMGWPKTDSDEYYTGFYTHKLMAYASTITNGHASGATQPPKSTVMSNQKLDDSSEEHIYALNETKTVSTSSKVES